MMKIVCSMSVRSTNASGLRKRLLARARWRKELTDATSRERRMKARGVLAGLTERNAHVMFAATESAVDDEATLIAYSVLITGQTPLLNGEGWDWSANAVAMSARAIAIAERLGQ
jgi:hypothetical protein